jgi:mannose-6-phosphate isomerase class I
MSLNGGRNRVAALVAAPYFVVDKFDMKEPHTFSTSDESGRSSVQVLVAIDGCAVIETPGAEPVTVAKGEGVAVPACLREFTVRPQWSIEFLKSYVPGKILPDPPTRT